MNFVEAKEKLFEMVPKNTNCTMGHIVRRIGGTVITECFVWAARFGYHYAGTWVDALDALSVEMGQKEADLYPESTKTTAVTSEMVEAGSKMASDLMNAKVCHEMGEMGGAKSWEEFKSGYKGKNLDLIKMYIDGEIESVMAIYLAMSREGE
jgi:hypothetical protein